MTKKKQEYKLRPGWKLFHLDRERPNCGRQSIDATPESAPHWYLVVKVPHKSTSVICVQNILLILPDIRLQCRHTFHLVWRKYINDKYEIQKWQIPKILNGVSCWPVSALEAGFRSSAQDWIINARLSFNRFVHSLAISPNSKKI